jgi:AbrB family looped-hinge helix DNA binding protein
MKVTRRGQVTIPKDLRERTGIDDGTEVDFKEDNGRIIIVKSLVKNPFAAWVGYLQHATDSDIEVKKMRGHRAHSR